MAAELTTLKTMTIWSVANKFINILPVEDDRSNFILSNDDSLRAVSFLMINEGCDTTFGQLVEMLNKNDYNATIEIDTIYKDTKCEIQTCVFNNAIFGIYPAQCDEHHVCDDDVCDKLIHFPCNPIVMFCPHEKSSDNVCQTVYNVDGKNVKCEAPFHRWHPKVVTSKDKKAMLLDNLKKSIKQNTNSYASKASKASKSNQPMQENQDQSPCKPSPRCAHVDRRSDSVCTTESFTGGTIVIRENESFATSLRRMLEFVIERDNVTNAFVVNNFINADWFAYMNYETIEEYIKKSGRCFTDEQINAFAKYFGDLETNLRIYKDNKDVCAFGSFCRNVESSCQRNHDVGFCATSIKVITMWSSTKRVSHDIKCCQLKHSDDYHVVTDMWNFLCDIALADNKIITGGLSFMFDDRISDEDLYKLVVKFEKSKCRNFIAFLALCACINSATQ